MQDRIRILVINPNSDEVTCQRIRETVDRFCKDIYDVDVVRLVTAPLLVASYEDRIMGVAELMQIIRENEDKYDAFVLACHADPNLDLAQEITSKPVIGIAEASMKIAASIGTGGFAVISPTLKTQAKKYALAHKYYLGDMLKGVVLGKSDEPEDLLEAAREAVKLPCVSAIVLGCANYTGADVYIEKQLGIPVIDGVACGLFLAAGMARYQRYKS